MNHLKIPHAIIRSFLVLLTLFTGLRAKANDCPDESAKMVITPGNQPAEYLLSFSTEQVLDNAHLSVFIIYLDANYPSKDQEIHDYDFTTGNFEQTLQFDLNGQYAIHLYLMSPDCFMSIEDTIEVAGAEHSINCSASMEVQLVNEDLGIYEVQWSELSFDLDLPEPYQFTAEHQIYEYDDSIVMITVPTSLASVKRLTPRGFNDYFTDKGNIVYKQTQPYIHLSPGQHMYLKEGEYNVKGRRAFSFEDTEGNLFQCDVTGEAMVNVSDIPVVPNCDAWQRDLTLESYIQWPGKELTPGERTFRIQYPGAPETNDLMQHHAYAFWLQAREIQWDFGDGETKIIPRTSALLDYDYYSKASHKYAQNGSYTVSFKVLSMAGCTLMETSKVIEIFELDQECQDLEVSIFEEDLPNSQKHRFTFTHNLPDPGAVFDKVVWKFDHEEVFEQETVDYLFKTNGEHTVELEVFYANCQRTFQKVVQVDDSFCSPWDFSALFNYWPEKDSIYMMARNIGSNYMYSWQVEDKEKAGLGLSAVALPMDSQNTTTKLKMTIEDTDASSPYFGISLSDSVLLHKAPEACDSDVQLTSSISSQEEPGKVSFDITTTTSDLDFYSITFGDGQSSYRNKICSDEDRDSDTREHTYAANGNYTVSLYVINSANCISILEQEVKVTTLPEPDDEDTVTCVHDPLRSNPIAVYPNPAKNELHISIKNTDQTARWNIVDLNGKKLLYGQLSNTDSRVDIRSLRKGLYILQTSVIGEVHQTKFLVN
ncbi:T9SS type A sorting domain-containing protein [Fulvivirga sp. M361]|uniref:PKD domain-containing protein n=1 Tax=Fulvivirga sp. M361 TaxID=2594266 RepID=UPI00117A12B3|nr:T9SS type A sorting domain-containing protein [Fulvivirga sp. M361]TRX54832.1 T9SS type A sorting domain-containing protein [Fulvivirga sp. M361]